MEPAAKSSSANKSVNFAALIGGFVVVLIVAGLGIKYSIDSSPSNTVPPRQTSATTRSTQTSTPTTTPSTPPATKVATPSANQHASLSATQSPKVTADHAPPGAEMKIPNNSTQPTVKSISQMRLGQSHRHKVEPPKPKPAAKVTRVKRDPWARIESRIKNTAPKSDRSEKSTKAPSRWSHMEKQLQPVSP